MRRSRLRPLAAALAAVLAAGAACRRAADVTGRWQREGQPAEWLRLDADHRWAGRSYMEAGELGGTWAQQGDTVRMTSSYGRGGTLVLHGDSVLEMQDGTRYRRAPR